MPGVAVSMALGGFIVAIAYALGRGGNSWGGKLFWVGQVLVYVAPASMLITRRSVSRFESQSVAVLLAVITYTIMECYSPLQFRFLDEFSHMQTADSILKSHHLFGANSVLPVSPYYPGLEVVSSAVASLSGLSLYVSGTIVVGVCHVLTTLGLYYLALEVTGRPRVAGLAAVLYASGPHYEFFDSYFTYEVMALPLMMACLVASVKMLKEALPRRRAMWGVTALCAAAATIVSHHITSYALVALLLCFVLAGQLFPEKLGRDWRLPTLWLVMAAMVGLWDGLVASGTGSYLEPIVDDLLKSSPAAGLRAVGFLSAGHGGSSAPEPLMDTLLEYTATAVLVPTVSVGAFQLWRGRAGRGGVMRVAVAIGCVGIVLLVVVRLGAADGSELAGRAYSYALVPGSIAGALALRSFVVGMQLRGGTWGRLIGCGVVVCAVGLVAGGDIAGGWPPYYARMPGSFEVDAWERSIDQHNLDVATWAAAHLPPYNGVGGDFSSSAIIAALATEDDVERVAGLFQSKRYSAENKRLAVQQRLSFVVVDLRMAKEAPASGYYFASGPDSKVFDHPIARGDLTKFANAAGVSTIFSDGTIVIYDLIGSLGRR